MFEFPYTIFIVVSVVAIILTTLTYCIRYKYIRRHMTTRPMQVVVVGQPHHPQTCWSIPIEQPPPAYHTVVTDVNPYYNPAPMNNRT